MTSAPTPAQAMTSHSLPSPCILVVDDDDTNRRIAQLILQRAGYRVCDAACGTSALAVLAGDWVSLVLLDLSMPGMDGLETCRHIRAKADEFSPVVIAYTAHVLDEDKATLLAAGFDDLLMKPISKAGLLGLVDKWLGEARDGR